MFPWEEGVMECARRLPPLGGGASQSLFLFRVRCIALPCPIHPSRPSAILSSAFGPTRIATLRLLPPCFGCLSMYPQLSSRRCLCFASFSPRFFLPLFLLPLPLRSFLSHVRLPPLTRHRSRLSPPRFFHYMYYIDILYFFPPYILTHTDSTL